MRYFTILILLALCCFSCKKDEVNAKTTDTSVQSVVTGVNGPTSGTVNETLTYSLLWPNSSKQNYFDHLTTSTLLSNTQTIKLYVATDTTKTDRPLSAVLKFKATSAGTYYLKFAKPGNDSTYSIIDTVVIR